MSAATPQRTAGKGTEGWVWGAFALCAVTAGFTIWLGLRPGGRAPVEAYRLGPFILGALAALYLFGTLVWGAVRRPLLQPGRLKGWIALGACLWWCSYPFPYPSSHEGHPSATPLRLPFDEPFDVAFAGDKPRENPLVLTPRTRFGLAFRRDEPAAIVAPTAATVVAIDRGLRGRVTLTLAPTGDGGEATGEHLGLAGLLEESVPLEVGAGVVPGTVLGRSEALTLFLFDAAGEGIPLRLGPFEADGRPVERGRPRRGQSVRPTPASGVSGDRPDH